jgi:death-on-curing protein
VKEPRWINELSLLLLHAESLAEYGGKEGLRDEGLMESALARPRNIFLYEQTSDVARLAAAYSTGIARNHPFIDGNKRVALLVIGLFLGKNGFEFEADKVEATKVMFGLAAGEIQEDELANWIAQHIRKQVE